MKTSGFKSHGTPESRKLQRAVNLKIFYYIIIHYYRNLIKKINYFIIKNKHIKFLIPKAFIQVFVISIFNISAGSIFYALENYPSIVTPQLIFVAHFAWF
jgi:hypothetical protein